MLLSSLLGGRGQRLGVKRGPWPLSETPGVLFGNSESSAGVDVDADSALSLSAVFAAVNLLSAVISSLPLVTYQRQGRNKLPALAEPVYRVLHSQFNLEMTAVIARRTLEVHRLLWGNAYGEISRTGRGQVAEVWPIEPWRVRPERDESSSVLQYRVDGQRIVAAEDMVHVPLISFDGISGNSFIDYAFESLGIGIATQEFAARFYANDARPGGILKHQGTPAEKARNELKKTWQEQHGGVKNARRVAVLWGGWEYVTDAAFDADKAQLLDQRRFSVEEVARWLNMPPHLLRDLSRATFSNIEHQGIDAVIYTFGPVLVMYEQEFDRKLLDPPNLYSKHNVTALLRGDSAARSAFYRELFGIGVFSPNEIRELEDWNPVEGGDERFVPLNMRTLVQAAEPESEPTTEADQSQTDDPAASAGPAGGDVQATALNGAQITGLLAVTTAVAQGQLPAGSAKATLRAAFPTLPDSLIAEIVDPLEEFEPAAQESPAEPGAPSTGPDDPEQDPAEPMPEHTPGDIPVSEGMRSLPVDSLRAILVAALQRLAGVEATAVRRIAERPGRLFVWMDDFYLKHQERLSEAVAPILRAIYKLAGTTGGQCRETLAGEWCAESRTALLDLSGSVGHSEFASAVTALVQKWKTERPARVAAEILPEVDNAESNASDP